MKEKFFHRMRTNAFLRVFQGIVFWVFLAPIFPPAVFPAENPNERSKGLKMAVEILPFPNLESRGNSTPSICGNGILEGSEKCDDGNRTPGDGCDANCFKETPCGNGKLDPGEACELDSDCKLGQVCSETCQCVVEEDKISCEDEGLLSSSSQCDCYKEVKIKHPKTKVEISCYECAAFVLPQNCCPSGPVGSASICQSQTGSSCTDSRSCTLVCPDTHPNLGKAAPTQDVQCCRCSSFDSTHCVDGSGNVQSTACGDGTIADMQFTAGSSDCGSIANPGGACMARCVGEGRDCGGGTV